LGYDVTDLGYNYRMDELRAAIGQAQLKRLASWNEKRRQLSNKYRELFALHCPDIQIPFSKGHPSAYHVLPTILPVTCNRQAIMQAMHEAGIQTTVHYPPVHLFSYYSTTFPCTQLPITEEFSKRELTLPLHPGLAFEQVETIVSVLIRCVIQ
jgi:dTDP-4-amino-4,6-dideoxygalactose transaminase